MDSIDDVIKHFPVDTRSTKPVDIELDTGSYLYSVTNSHLIPSGYTGVSYILDTPQAEMIACHPHIVGESLRAHCLGIAGEFVRSIDELGLLTKEDTAIMHILRAGAGYMVAEATPYKVPIISVRTEYKKTGYRDHSDDNRSLEVSYKNYPHNMSKISTLIIPDTYATGRSAEAALNDCFEHRIHPDLIILYGFIAIPSLQRIGALCEQRNIKLISFALCDLTQLAHNNYDMCVYGPDESLYLATGEYKELGSIVSSDTLERMIPRYIPGLDQPRDWSERQAELFNGVEREHGNIRGHLEKSIKIIMNLKEINGQHDWYTDMQKSATEKELLELRKILNKYK
ncbi:MAG: hypothetical protein NWE89_11025 [Candidatus Bathyarchaeota archaeon]|nr:hypothetical protein [Candidatus Bathyarchaeota archaeon]